MKSTLYTIQEAIRAKLSEEETIKEYGVEVYSRKVKDMESELDNKLAAMGIAVFVWPPEPKSSRANMPRPCFDASTVRVDIIEKPLFNENENELNAWTLWEAAARALHHCDLHIEGVRTLALAGEPWQDNSTAEVRVFSLVMGTAFSLF